MYIAEMPQDAVAKYFSKNNSIYFSDNINLENLDTLVIHEYLHTNGKILKLGLYDLSTNKGQGINEAAVQLMATKALLTKSDTVKYYNLELLTPSPLFYPLETALINQMMYFTGSYPLFHSTLYSNNVFKNTFIAKSNEKAYNIIEKNFDLIIYYEELLSISYTEQQNSINNKKINKLSKKIENIKLLIQNLTIETQNLIIENCFNAEFDAIRDSNSLNQFRQHLYNFNTILIKADSYDFYSKYYYEMMNKLEEKAELIKEHGILTYLNDLQTDLLDLEKDNFGFKFFKKLFDKLKLLFEEAVREKN